MKQFFALSSLVLLIGAPSCARKSSPKSILGRYELSASDNSGRLVFTGAISLTSLEQTHVKGQCRIVWEKNAVADRLDQDTKCEGRIEQKVIAIDTAPSMDDGGMLLEGQLGEDRITGIWKMDGFVTSGPLGKFEAVRKN